MKEKKSPSRDPRIANLDLVQVWDEEIQEFRHEQIDNISRSGVFILTESPYPVSQRVRMVFTLVTEPESDASDSPNIIPVDVVGEVVRVVVDRDEQIAANPGMGVKFIDLNPQATQLIDEIVSRRLETTPTGI